MTWSILAREASTDRIGAAVASRFFAVGALTIRVEGGRFAMASQALANPMYLVHAAPELRTGAAPAAVLRALVGADAGREQRQFHILGADGAIAQHTGRECVAWAGMASAPDVSVAGNMLAGPQVVERTLQGFLAASGDLVERLLAAMEAGEVAGGDKRGKQSAALVVCGADPYPLLDIRADDHPDPLAELRRLHRVSQERYAIMRRHLPGVAHPWGTLDRAAIEADMAAQAKD